MTTDNTNTTRNDSLAARTDTWLQSLLVWSPGQRDIIKTVALVLMVLDGEPAEFGKNRTLRFSGHP
ncbi:hypothetical protein HEO03_021455, partial [Escherichia coli]|nr:hypothetical protein [Escherichia coli]